MQGRSISDSESRHFKVICIGAGPAGLSAAYLLAKENCPVLVLEKDPVSVGGISRTENRQGYLMDIGGHRFFSKSQEVEQLWEELLGDHFLLRPRKSRIFYNGRFFEYPLQAFDALRKLGLIESARCILSYVKACFFPIARPRTFQDWVTNKFGARLFTIFFKTYTEKVWGMSCSEISADWAAQRIKGLSLTTAIINSLPLPGKRRTPKGVVKTLIDKFRYPEKGPGMMWEEAARKILALGGEIRMGSSVTECAHAGDKWTVTYSDGKREYRSTADQLISSMPLSQMIRQLSPHVSSLVLNAADSLKYRDFLIVSLVVVDKQVFDDNWIYIHDPNVKVGRIQNFKSWSAAMVPDASTTCYGMEYFCFEGDGLWQSKDADLIALVTEEMIRLGLALREDILKGFVVRQQKAYPVYDADYKSHLDIIRTALQDYPTLHPVGRNGMHRYNNQDHSMMTAMLTVKNILSGKTLYDVWNVNEDAEYHEEIKEAESLPKGRTVPMKTTA
jgi:protoporphyrinogen oxidase